MAKARKPNEKPARRRRRWGKASHMKNRWTVGFNDEEAAEVEWARARATLGMSAWLRMVAIAAAREARRTAKE